MTFFFGDCDAQNPLRRDPSLSHTSQAGRRAGQTEDGIFVAPEYMFANPITNHNLGSHQRGDDRHLAQGTKVDIENWMKQLSKRFPNMLMIPGSVAWKKPRERDTSTYLQYKKELGSPLSEDQLKAKFNQKKASRIEKAVEPVSNNVVVDEFLRTKDQRKDVLNKPDVELARNTCYVYLNGVRVAKYHKNTDYHEVLLAPEKTVYVPGTSIPTFEVDGIWFGLEICLDHACGSLTKWLQLPPPPARTNSLLQPPPRTNSLLQLPPPPPPPRTASVPQRRVPVGKVDVHIILSAWVAMDSAHMVKDAMVVHASSNEQVSRVYPKVKDRSLANDVTLYEFEITK
jgi:hypothetical protein